MNQTNLIAFYTLARKDLCRIFRIWPQTLLPSSITITLYFIIFGSFIGREIGQMNNIPYMTYIAPGLIMMSVITSSYANTVGSFYSTRFIRNIDEVLISPTSNMTILMGYTCGGVLRGFVVGIITTIITLFFTSVSLHSITHTLLFFVLTSTVFSLAGFTNGVFANSFDDINIVPTFILTPLTYLGGVFYSIQVLAEPWKSISFFNPILYFINGFRYGMLGVSDTSIAYSYAMLFFLLVALMTLNLRILSKGYRIKS